MDVPIDDVMIVTGSGQGIDMISKLLVNPGDTVLCEEFCYQGAMRRFRQLGAKLEAMKLDGDGIVIDALAAQLAALKSKGITPKFIYTIPTIQNPTASILPLDRRHALLKLARQHNIAIFEDECYADLLWQGVEAPPSLYALDPGCVIHLGSFSKSLAPALRLGYIVAPAALIAELRVLRRLMIRHPTAFIERSFAQFLALGYYDAFNRRLVAVYTLAAAYAGAAGALLAAFFVLYQWLFFTYADGTPGMRYAKIALCTFEDENPTRQQMRRRIVALLLSALPVGLGFVWALFDDDRMTWHDRISRTYQRSYR